MEIPRLRKRLMAIAELVRPGKKIADIGTDHANLPVYLVKMGISPGGVAGDIYPLPLERARATIEAYGTADVLTPVLGDGLREIGPEQADDIIIAGMGFDLITRIVEETPWLRDGDKHLILQPMTGVPQVRQYLLGAGFSIEHEVPVTENGHSYAIISAYYTGEKRACTPLFAQVGLIPTATDMAERKAYLQRQVKRLRTIANGLAKGRAGGEDAKGLHALAEEIEALI